MLEVSDTKWRWRVDPNNDRAVQTKPNKQGARWQEFDTYDCPQIAREVVLACQGMKPPGTRKEEAA